MNEEQKALREAVARAMYAATVTAAVDKGLTVTWENEGARVRELYLAEASAAIALVLEEAARCADEEGWTEWRQKETHVSERNAAKRDCADEIAAAIRAMIGTSD